MTEKTYKREIAVTMLIFFATLTVAGMWFPQASDAAESLKYEVFGFSALAFGMDAYAKQVRK